MAGLVAVAGAGVGAGQAAAAADGSGASRAVERGYAVSCVGEAGGVSVVVDLYQNSAYGTHAGVSVTAADGMEYGGGYGPEEFLVFDGGRVDASVPVRRLDESGEAAGSAVVTGVYATAGRRSGCMRSSRIRRGPTWSRTAPTPRSRRTSAWTCSAPPCLCPARPPSPSTCACGGSTPGAVSAGAACTGRRPPR